MYFKFPFSFASILNILVYIHIQTIILYYFNETFSFNFISCFFFCFRFIVQHKNEFSMNFKLKIEYIIPSMAPIILCTIICIIISCKNDDEHFFNLLFCFFLPLANEKPNETRSWRMKENTKKKEKN